MYVEIENIALGRYEGILARPHLDGVPQFSEQALKVFSVARVEQHLKFKSSICPRCVFFEDCELIPRLDFNVLDRESKEVGNGPFTLKENSSVPVAGTALIKIAESVVEVYDPLDFVSRKAVCLLKLSEDDDPTLRKVRTLSDA